jgi:hypothetical protein
MEVITSTGTEGVGLVQLAHHLWGALVGEGDVHHGGVYAPLGHPLAALGHGPRLGNDLHAVLPAHQQRGRLAERGVVLDEQY